MRKTTLVSTSCLVLAGATTSVYASSPAGVWSFPDEVTIVDESSDQPVVVIAGLFTVWTGEGTVGGDWGMQGYEPGDWGYMVYQCKAGDKALCLMQWGELKTAASDGACAGWGNQDAAAGTVRADGATTSPDVYPLDQGVVTGVTPCNYLETVPPEDPPVADTVPPVEVAVEPSPEPGPEPTPEPATEAAPTTTSPDVSSGTDATVAADTAVSGETESEGGACTGAGLGLVPGLGALVGLLALALRRRR